MPFSRTFHKDSYIAYLHARDLVERLHLAHVYLCFGYDEPLTRAHLSEAIRECGALNQSLDALLADLNAERAAA